MRRVGVLRSQVEETRTLTDKPFAVNLVTVAPAYQEQLAALPDMPVDYVFFAGSIPKEKEVAIAKNAGKKTICFASTLSIAERMIRFGADAIMLEGSEAGGHIGHVSAMVLIQQLLFKFGDQIPVFVAGGIATGKMMAHALLMGAAGVQIGTRFRHDGRMFRAREIQGCVHACQRPRRHCNAAIRFPSSGRRRPRAQEQRA